MLAAQFDVFLLDLDGVVYIGNQPLPGARETIERLKKDAKQIFFVTNDPVPTRQKFVQRLETMGIPAQLSEVVSCGWATAQYLQQQHIETAYVLGSAGLKWEMEQAGISVVEEVSLERAPGGKNEITQPSSSSVQAVVVGWNEKISFEDIQKATQLIFQGARFIATNADTSFPGPQGPMPATGSIVKAIETTVGEEATIIGKPYPLMFEMTLGQLESDQRTVMIGDNPDTDILGAHQAGLPALLISNQRDRENQKAQKIHHTSSHQEDSPFSQDLRQPEAILTGLKDLYQSNKGVE